jgi:uncharacterized protein (TIGR03435 family)
MKFLRSSFILFGFCLGSALGQTLTFEVASVKPAGTLNPQKIMSGEQRIGRKVDKARVEYNSVALGELIAEAYKVKSFQVSGPDWMSGGLGVPRFDIQAKMPAGATEDQIPQMLQALLAERFGLKIHKDSKERNIYELVVAKTGLKMKPSEATPEEPAPGINVSGNLQDGKGVTVKGGPDGGTTHVIPSADGKGMRIELSKLSVDRLVELLSRMVDRPVVDRTGLKGDYQVALELPMAAMMAMAGSMSGGPMPGRGGDGNRMVEASDPGTSIFESVDKLGLKLEARKGPLETIVVDHLEKAPTEN